MRSGSFRRRIRKSLSHNKFIKSGPGVTAGVAFLFRAKMQRRQEDISLCFSVFAGNIFGFTGKNSGFTGKAPFHT